MTTRSRTAALVLSALAGCAVLNLCIGVRGNSPVQPPSEGKGPAPGGDVAVVRHIAGNASCSGRSCHGGLEANPGKAVGQNEVLLFAGHDRHARAYQALLGERARRMADNLAVTNADGKAIPAHEDARCLACHATPQLAEVSPAATERRASLLADGVGCEACHGPSRGNNGGWLLAHTGEAFVKAHGDQAKQAELYAKYGMTHLQDVKVQAQVCVGCHVGAPRDENAGLPRRDAYHDIMAAGHPRLTFELTAYRDNMPPHWKRDAWTHDWRRAAFPENSYEAKSWAIGQVETARASLRLTDDRAARAEKEQGAPWPEFAEYDCYACHAGLQEKSWRRESAFPALREKDKAFVPGSFPWSRWSWTLLPDVTGKKDNAVAEPFHAVARTMRRPLPDLAEVHTQVGAARGALASLEKAVGATTYDQTTVRKVLQAMAPGDEKTVKAMTWEEIQQLVLAGYALSGQLPEAKRKALEKPLAEVAALLAYPPGNESPSQFRHDPKIDAALLDLGKALKAE